MNNGPIVIVGPRGRGNSTAAAILSRELGLKAVETSDVLIDHLAEICSAGPWPHAGFAGGGPLGNWKRYISSRKNEYRPMLIALADKLRAQNPTVLIEGAIERGGRIIVGPRKRAEFYTWMGAHPLTHVIEIEVFGSGAGEPPSDGFELFDLSPFPRLHIIERVFGHDDVFQSDVKGVASKIHEQIVGGNNVKK